MIDTGGTLPGTFRLGVVGLLFDYKEFVTVGTQM